MPYHDGRLKIYLRLPEEEIENYHEHTKERYGVHRSTSAWVRDLMEAAIEFERLTGKGANDLIRSMSKAKVLEEGLEREKHLQSSIAYFIG